MDNKPSYIVVRNYLHEALLNKTDLYDQVPCMHVLGTNKLYGLKLLEYLFIKERVQDRYDYVVFVDEDCYVYKAAEHIEGIISMMEEKGSDIVGVPDGGGVIEHRNHRRDVPNLFFAVFKTAKLKRCIFARDYADFTIPDGEDSFEPYYKMLCYMTGPLKMIFQPILNVVNEKGGTTIVRYGSERLCMHTWYSRKYGEDKDETYRIDYMMLSARKYEDDSVTFVVPLSRDAMFNKQVAKNFKDTFEPYFKGKIRFLPVRQQEERPFMRGQLLNIGADFVQTRWVAFIDNDIINIDSFDPKEVYHQLGDRPYVAFDMVAQGNMEDGKFVTKSSQLRPDGFGAFVFMQIDDFKQHGGFSNLCMGWGAEDNILNIKMGLMRYKHTIGHITHPRRCNEHKECSAFNRKVWQMYKRGEIDKHKDGYRQTYYACEAIQVLDEQPISLSVKEIGVVEGYQYQDLYNEQYERAKAGK